MLIFAVVTLYHKDSILSQETLGISQLLVVSQYHKILGNSQDLPVFSGPVSECSRRSGLHNEGFPLQTRLRARPNTEESVA